MPRHRQFCVFVCVCVGQRKHVLKRACLFVRVAVAFRRRRRRPSLAGGRAHANVSQTNCRRSLGARNRERNRMHTQTPAQSWAQRSSNQVCVSLNMHMHSRVQWLSGTQMWGGFFPTRFGVWMRPKSVVEVVRACLLAGAGVTFRWCGWWQSKTRFSRFSKWNGQRYDVFDVCVCACFSDWS